MPYLVHAGARKTAELHRLVLAFWLSLLLCACSGPSGDRLEKVKAAGELVILIPHGPGADLDMPDSPSGFDYDLAKAFADSLGVQVRAVDAGRDDDILAKLDRGAANMAVAVTVTDEVRERYLITPAYQQVREQVVYHRDNLAPKNIADLAGRQIEVPLGSGYAARLAELKETYKDLRWSTVSDTDSETLLELVWSGLLEITVVDSDIVALNRQFFPELQVAFDLAPPRSLAWAVPLGADHSLFDAATQFLERFRNSGELARLLDRYYGPASQANPINLRVYHARINNLLPAYQNLFERAGRETELDWRLLAAVSYQESYWDPKSISPTGVRGMMMLTEETARQMNVANLADPMQSILGGAHYLRDLYDRLTYIPLPDRLWFTLAAYNVGFMHVEDARIFTQQAGKDPNKWSDVKKYLPLLEQPKWFARARFGFARGNEPVQFVDRIRTYFDVLVKHDDDERARSRTGALKLKLPAI